MADAAAGAADSPLPATPESPAGEGVHAIEVDAGGDASTDRPPLQELLSTPVVCGLADVLGAVWRQLCDRLCNQSPPLDLKSPFDTIKTAVPKQGHPTSLLRCQVVSYLAGNAAALDAVLATVEEDARKAAEVKIARNSKMPEHRKQHLRDEAEAVIAKVKAAPDELKRLVGDRLSGEAAQWLGNPAVLATATAEVTWKKTDTRSTRSKGFETRVAEWARQRYPGCRVELNAFIMNKVPTDAKVKMEVDALVLAPSALPTAADTPDASASHATTSCRLRTAMATTLGLGKEVESLSSRLLRLSRRVDAAHAARVSQPLEETSREAVLRWLRLRSPRAKLAAGSTSLATAVHGSLTAIVEAKLATSSLPDDLRKCCNLRVVLEQSERLRFKTTANKKMRGEEYVEEFATELGGTHIDVCVSETPGTTLVDLFKKSVIQQARMHQVEAIATAALSAAAPMKLDLLLAPPNGGAAAGGEGVEEVGAEDEATGVRTTLHPVAIASHVSLGIRRTAFARALVKAKKLSYWVVPIPEAGNEA